MERDTRHKGADLVYYRLGVGRGWKIQGAKRQFLEIEDGAMYCGRQNAAPPPRGHILIPRTSDYIILHGR